ncbi:MAG: response regulator [Sulfurimonas sp.]|uniref:hybrid sensor histidine kinase/response regulator n=1 Tax=Sulfurimonas sp. TaxID=2022749 RepID=UPI0025FF1C31|nr:chemotaxis protein CheW [Sulfurimonas sp.]MCK9492277.1 response regulator [Sulfurimonas sp.]
MDEFQEILQDFLVEAFELVEKLDEDLVELESTPEDLELLNGIFRVAHTIKGASSFLNFDVLTHLTHHMEDVLNKARHGELIITPDVMDVVLESIDLMKSLLSIIRDTSSDAGVDVSECVVRLDKISGGDGDVPTPVASAPIIEATLDEPEEAKEEEDEPDYDNMSDDDVEAEIQRLLEQRQEEDKAKRAAKVAAGEEVLAPPPDPDEEAPSEPAKASKPEKKPEPKAEPIKAPVPRASTKAKSMNDDEGLDAKAAAPAKRTNNTVDQTIRVDVKRLDHLMNLIGELVLAKNRLIKINDDVEERYEGEEFLEELNQVVSIVSLVTTDLQIAVMKTRMLPIGKVFNKFPRMIRDLSRELNKKIELTIKGEETELDKSIVEEIGDPLVHIIRNSCDHGIETPEVRLANGKNETGTISLKAYNEGNQIVIQIDDDGKGLNAEILKSKALEKGLISEKEADNMGEKEAFMLIMKPGFSMAAAVTNVSGRGVGMDVVKTNIEKVNGIIDIESETGIGSSVKLKIPLTLAIIQALLVGVQEEAYAIPLSSVLETVRISKDEIYTVESRSVMRLRDDVLSLVHIGDIFEVERILDSSEHAYVVVLGLGAQKLGLIVDSLVGQEEIVIKSLGEYLKGIEGIAGATIRGDGGVTLIVDVVALMDIAKNVKATSMISDQKSESAQSREKTKASDYTIMIVDDSKTDRMIMRKSLEATGMSLVEATDGQEALNILKQGDHHFDAMLIDIEMPRMDGYTLATEIKKYNRYKTMPLIAVTSRTGKSDRMRGVESGMVEYITKPYSADYLSSVVQRNVNFKSEFLS